MVTSIIDKVKTEIHQSQSQQKKLIVHCCYHKVATGFFAIILRKIAEEFSWKFQSCKQEKLSPDTNIFLQNHSKVNLSSLPPYVGSHIIRDPRDMIVSGYFYHLWCSEKWCHIKKPKYNNYTYQELLNSVPQEEGIAIEIDRVKWDVNHMSNWDYSNPNFIEIRLEDIVKNEKGMMIKVFQNYGFRNEDLTRAISIYEKYSFEKIARRKRGEENKQKHFRKGVSGDWRNHFTPKHKEIFKELYQDVLIKLGYEQDNNW